MSLTPLQMDQVRTKVSYSEVDLPYNGYMDILANVTKLSGNILRGQLQKYTDEQKFEFNGDHVQELGNMADQKFLELQSSLDVKKVAQENWDQSNTETVRNMDERIQDVMPQLEEVRDNLQGRLSRVRELYDSVSKVNNELEVLLEGRTSLAASRSQWEKELGNSLTEKLIERNYLRKTGSNEEKYRVYDNFTKGPNELRHTNKTIKTDIERLSEELGSYKVNWLKDADIFSQMTSVLKEEMGKRDLDIQQGEDDEEMDYEDEPEPEDEPEDDEPEDENMLEEQVGEAGEQAEDGSEERGEEPIEEEPEHHYKDSQNEADLESTPGS